MFRCIYTLENHERSTAEHILQNSLGARWTSEVIVCDELQQTFGDTIDVEVANGIRAIRNLFGTLGGRGGEGPSLQTTTSDGQPIEMLPGGRPRFREPVVEEGTPTGDKVPFCVVMPNANQIGWALHQVRQRYPHAEIDEAAIMAQARHVRSYANEIEIPVVFGGRQFFRGLLKAAFNLLGTSKQDIIFDYCFDSVRAFIAKDEGESSDFIRWIDFSDPLDIPHLGAADQFIGISSKDGFVFGVVQLFGDLPYAFQLAENFTGAEFQCSYLVDPFRKAEPAELRQVEFSHGSLPNPTELPRNPNETVAEALKQRMFRIVESAQRRMQEAGLDDVIQQGCGPADGRPFDAEMAARLAEDVAHFIARVPQDRGPVENGG